MNHYSRKKAKKASERGRRMGIASGVARRKKMMEREPELRPRDEGAFIGTIDIRIGPTVRRYFLRQGPRRNNLRIEAQGREIVTGWDGLLSKLRKHLAPFTRQAI